MPTTYPNSISYLQARQIGDIQSRGYLSTALWGADLMGLIPITTPNDWMQDVQYKRVYSAGRRSSVRLLNESVDIQNTKRFTQDTELVAIYTTETISIDRRIAEDKPGDFDVQLDFAFEDLVKNMNFDIVNSVPTTDGRGILGFKGRVPIGTRWDFNTAANVPGVGGSTISLSTGAGLLKFLRIFRAAHDEMINTPGTQILAVGNRFLIQALSAGRDQLGANYTGGFGETTDIFNKRLLTIDGIPFLSMRGDSDPANETFQFDEPDPTSGALNQTSSFFLFAFGGAPNDDSKKIPPGVRLLSNDQGTGEGVIRTYTFENLDQFTGRKEFDMGLRTPDRSLMRISGLKP